MIKVRLYKQYCKYEFIHEGYESKKKIKLNI